MTRIDVVSGLLGEEKTTLIAYEAMSDFSILSAKLTKNLLI